MQKPVLINAMSRDREAVIAAVGRMEIADYMIEGLRLQTFGDVEIVVYDSTVDGTYRGKPFEIRDVITTTVWRRGNDGWRVAHRHESPRS